MKSIYQSINKMAAEKIMGWRNGGMSWYSPNDKNEVKFYCDKWNPCRNISHAFMVLGKSKVRFSISNEEFTIEHVYINENGGLNLKVVKRKVRQSRLALAITVSCLRLSIPKKERK